MNLVIDIGNTAIKIGEFDQQELKHKHILDNAEDLRLYLQDVHVQNCIVSSVKTDAKQVIDAINANKKFMLAQNLPLPVINKYATPATLGMDRIAAVCGAHQLFPSTACLVIDSGTCITYEILDDQGNYLGGAISPGLSMRYKALHTFTAKLPLVTSQEDAPLIGNSTETCIKSGVVNGILAEMDGIIDQYKNKFPGLRVILCGGDTPFFENQLKASIFASPDLVLIGLNSILSYNVNL